jgi:hypothetical protein
MGRDGMTFLVIFWTFNFNSFNFAQQIYLSLLKRPIQRIRIKRNLFKEIHTQFHMNYLIRTTKHLS